MAEMDPDTFMRFVRETLPDETVNRFLWHSLETNISKIQQEMDNFFNMKRKTFIELGNVEMEARFLHKLFPHVPFDDISKQLRVFVDLPNRREIVLRLLLSSHLPEQTKGYKRSCEEDVDSGNLVKTSRVDLSDQTVTINCQTKEKCVDMGSTLKQEIPQDLPIKHELGWNLPKKEVHGLDMPSLGENQPRLAIKQEVGWNLQADITQVPAPKDLPHTITSNQAPEEVFDLVGYLHEITRAPAYQIAACCKKLRLDLSQKPAEMPLLVVLDMLLANEFPSDSDDEGTNRVICLDSVGDNTVTIIDDSMIDSQKTIIINDESSTEQVVHTITDEMDKSEASATQKEEPQIIEETNMVVDSTDTSDSSANGNPQTQEAPVTGMQNSTLAESIRHIFGEYRNRRENSSDSDDETVPRQFQGIKRSKDKVTNSKVESQKDEQPAETEEKRRRLGANWWTAVAPTNEALEVAPQKDSELVKAEEGTRSLGEHWWTAVIPTEEAVKIRLKRVTQKCTSDEPMLPTSSLDASESPRPTVIKIKSEERTRSKSNQARASSSVPSSSTTAPSMFQQQSALTPFGAPSTSRRLCATSTTVLPSTSKQEKDKESSSSQTSSTSKLPEVRTEQGPSTSSVVVPVVMDENLVRSASSIFPDACLDYLRKICANKNFSEQTVDEIVTVILESNGEYPKRKLKEPEPEDYPINPLQTLMELLPDADPDYLSMMCDRFQGNVDAVKTFLNEAMENRNYPTLKEYQRKHQLSSQQKQYTTDFTVENFLKVIPDPATFFNDKQRTVTMDDGSAHYAIVFLRNSFDRLSVRHIQQIFHANKDKLIPSYRALATLTAQPSSNMKSRRKTVPLPTQLQNIPLLQEIAYLEHMSEIEAHLKAVKAREETEILEAKKDGVMVTCSCCYDEDVLPRNVITCNQGCQFCKACVVRSTEILFGEGKLDFPCLLDCSSHFSLQTLQIVLSPNLFSKLAQKKAVEEVKSAGIEELETCPFCDFATIPPEGDKVFTCLNPDCMKESCRNCKEPSHLPLRCDEVEKDEEVKARVFVENKMTEALLRTCYKCGVKFFKEEGCNKMTCSCGAMMCYICKQPVTDYRHFNGQGGDRFDLCPLYSDTNETNKNDVLRGAEEAKQEIGNRELKHDPAKDVQNHYKKKKNKASQLPAMNNLGNGAMNAYLQHLQRGGQRH